MKGERIITTIIFALSILLIFPACSAAVAPPAYEHEERLKVTFVDNGLFRVFGENVVGNTFFVNRGEDLTVTVDSNDGLFLSASDYDGSRIVYGNDCTKIILPSVRRSQRVRLTFIESSETIVYDSNHGDFLNSDETALPLPCDLSRHIRQNTDIGKELVRDGYTLTGWNTSPDGSGDHIGLGSRYTVNLGETAVLYAEWAKWSDVSDFDYALADDGASVYITGYDGNEDVLCIPARLDGLPVTRISRNAFVGCVATTVIFPDSVARVAMGAFRDCAIKELYLYDNIEVISDRSFSGCTEFETVHINAVEPPKWTDYDRHSNLADKYDILMKHKNSKKVVVFGGSGSYFSVDTRQMTDELADLGYVVINMAVNANFNAHMQFEMIEPFMRKGDILIHIPETGMAQMMAERRISDVRIWHGLESNFDLVSHIDIREVDNFFDSFTSFNTTRATRRDKTYADYVQNIDELGNWGYVDVQTGAFTTYKQERGENTPFTYESIIEPAYLAEQAVTRRKTVYKKFEREGVRVFLSNAALNADGLAYELFGGWGNNEHIKCHELALEFDALNKSAFSEYEILVGISDCLYGGGRFFNSDYHLGSDASEEHTARLTTELLRRLLGARPSFPKIGRAADNGSN